MRRARGFRYFVFYFIDQLQPKIVLLKMKGLLLGSKKGKFREFDLAGYYSTWLLVFQKYKDVNECFYCFRKDLANLFTRYVYLPKLKLNFKNNTIWRIQVNRNLRVGQKKRQIDKGKG